MAPSVRISAKSARYLLQMLQAGPSTPFLISDMERVADELRRALEPRPKSSQAKRTEKKRRAKSASTKEIRAAVMERAGDKCEACRVGFCGMDHAELDHFWGKGKTPQTIENCWAIHHTCHRDKTNNHPSAVWWLNQFVAYSIRYGYAAEEAKAKARLDALRLTRGET